MDNAYDSLDAHLAAAGDIARASVPMGMLLAWCTNMHMLSDETLREHERLILRLRFQEALGSELLVACGGVLTRDLFNEEGHRFLDGFYPDYMDLFCEVFGDDRYAVRDNWGNYDKLAAALTRRYMSRPARGPGLAAKIVGWFKR